jgi:copper(I)-binding protein
VNPAPAPTRARRARLVAGAAAAAGALLLTGCGAGQVASTTSQVAAVNGASGSSASNLVALRDVVMVYPGDGSATWPAGSDVPLTFTLVNSAGTADTLQRVSTPAAESVEVTGTTTIPARASVVGVADAQGAGEQAAQQSTENQNSETPALYAGTVQVTLQGLTSSITSGLTATVTFTFANAGDVVVPVPIASAEYERTDGTHGGPGASTSAGEGS